MSEHIHTFGAWESSRFAGTLHRKCTDPSCRVVSLDADEERAVTSKYSISLTLTIKGQQVKTEVAADTRAECFYKICQLERNASRLGWATVVGVLTLKNEVRADD